MPHQRLTNYAGVCVYVCACHMYIFDFSEYGKARPLEYGLRSQRFSTDEDAEEAVHQWFHAGRNRRRLQ